MEITCPRCNTAMGMKIIKGKRPGWECLGCGIFFAKQTWEVRDGTLVRKYAKPKKRNTYVNKEALSVGKKVKIQTLDEWDVLDPNRVEKGLPDLSEW